MVPNLIQNQQPNQIRSHGIGREEYAADVPDAADDYVGTALAHDPERIHQAKLEFLSNRRCRRDVRDIGRTAIGVVPPGVLY